MASGGDDKEGNNVRNKKKKKEKLAEELAEELAEAEDTTAGIEHRPVTNRPFTRSQQSIVNITGHVGTIQIGDNNIISSSSTTNVPKRVNSANEQKKKKKRKTTK